MKRNLLIPNLQILLLHFRYLPREQESMSFSENPYKCTKVFEQRRITHRKVLLIFRVVEDELPPMRILSCTSLNIFVS